MACQGDEIMVITARASTVRTGFMRQILFIKGHGLISYYSEPAILVTVLSVSLKSLILPVLALSLYFNIKDACALATGYFIAIDFRRKA